MLQKLYTLLRTKFLEGKSIKDATAQAQWRILLEAAVIAEVEVKVARRKKRQATIPSTFPMLLPRFLAAATLLSRCPTYHAASVGIARIASPVLVVDACAAPAPHRLRRHALCLARPRARPPQQGRARTCKEGEALHAASLHVNGPDVATTVCCHCAGRGRGLR